MRFFSVKRPLIQRAGLLIIAACLSACVAGGGKKDLALDRLQDELRDLQAQSNVRQLAPYALAEAERAVREVDLAAKESAERDHLTYVAERRLDLVKNEVRRAESAQNTASLRETRADLLVRISQLEADSARREAEQARMLGSARAEEAERARQAASSARQLSEESALSAEQAREEAAQARRLADAQAEEASLARQEAKLVGEQAAALKRRLDHMQLRETAQGTVITLGDVLFESAAADLLPAAQQAVSDVAELLQSQPEKQVRIEGHTDSQGSAQFNQQLSENRAASVRDALVSNGIDAGRIKIIGLGEDFPVADNSTDAGRSQNRRVDVILLD